MTTISMPTRRLLTRAPLLAAMLAASAAAIAAPPAIGPTVDGTLNRIAGNKLAMTTKDGHEKFLAFPNDAKVTLDGKPCKAADIKSGTTIRVTIKSNDNSVAVRIEALAKNKKFASVLKEGIVVSFWGNRLVIAGPRGEQELPRTFARDTKITLDGKPASAADLKPGMRVRITSQSDAPLAATQVDALDKTRAFPTPRLEGAVVSVTKEKLIITGAPGQDNQECTLASDAKITCDGRSCKASALKPGMRVRVTPQASDPNAAASVESLDKSRTFASP